MQIPISNSVDQREEIEFLKKNQEVFVRALVKDVEKVKELMSELLSNALELSVAQELLLLLQKISGSAEMYECHDHALYANTLLNVVASAIHDGMDSATAELLKVKTQKLIGVTVRLEESTLNKPEVKFFRGQSEDCWSITTVFVGDLTTISDELQSKSYHSMCVGFDDLASLKVRPLNLVLLQSDVETDESLKTKFEAYLDRQLVKPMVVFLTDSRMPADISASLEMGADRCVARKDIVQHLLGHYNDYSHMKGLTVAILNDEPMNYEPLERNLRFLGFKTNTCENLLDFVEMSMRDTPDLFVVDISSSHAHEGLDVIKYLRNHERFAFHPILFINSKNDDEIGYLARNVGADDVLSKSIDDRNLASIIANKLIKSRQASCRACNDAVTGLLNDRTFEESLQLMIKFARRKNHCLSLIVLEISELKKVNQQFGHLHGDELLRSMSVILNERLRESDLIGYLNGGRFVLALPDTDLAQADLLVSDLLYRFSSQVFEFADDACQMSFIAGLAGFPELETPEELVNVAAASLAQARQAQVK